jgi:hypothetical protein
MNSPKIEYIGDMSSLQKQYRFRQEEISAKDRDFYELNQHFREGKNVADFIESSSSTKLVMSLAETLTPNVTESNIFEAVRGKKIKREVERELVQQPSAESPNQLRNNDGMAVYCNLCDVSPTNFGPSSSPNHQQQIHFNLMPLTYYTPMVPHTNIMMNCNNIPIQPNHFEILEMDDPSIIWQ